MGERVESTVATLKDTRDHKILTSHGALASYQHRFFGKPEICSRGDAEENKHHLIFTCKKWKKEVRNSPQTTQISPLELYYIIKNQEH
ncbi:hypothetical protein CDAR_107771 [Caerostris darwini]|uniref:Reverse transcriptase zinc-binding domain-containing protein n=1 Tax=Caerostris darwini TaxID=1538125 RepID=A0AAV4T1I0_9ARAC|nr:hypothetical protein CDAR_107771 [Caerostris darwini]